MAQEHSMGDHYITLTMKFEILIKKFVYLHESLIIQLI
jgi:hypothetical protein